MEQSELEHLKQLLHEGETYVEFRKINGEIREMYCTLKESLIPQEENAEPKRQKAKNDSVLAVYDLKAEGWRSFRLDSVLSYG